MQINYSQNSTQPSFDISGLKTLTDEVGKIVVGQQEVLEGILLSLLCNGHVLLEGVPGVAKTTMVKAITQAIGLSFKRIQFTPDLLPSDLIGTLIYNQRTQDFETKKGPIFANLILADEINRAPAKVQAALLEAMQEQQVTIGSETFLLPRPFIVFATQNPIEQEGTYQLPEAQVDRFMFKLMVGYPTMAQEKEIAKQGPVPAHIYPALSPEMLAQYQEFVHQIYVDERIVHYIVNIVHATRNPASFNVQKLGPLLTYGASPRATRALYKAAQAYALLQNRQFVIPDDVKKMAPAVLRHRIGVSYQATNEGLTPDKIIFTLLSALQTP
jgi:MoxR-like ATPase